MALGLSSFSPSMSYSYWTVLGVVPQTGAQAALQGLGRSCCSLQSKQICLLAKSAGISPKRNFCIIPTAPPSASSHAREEHSEMICCLGHHGLSSCFVLKLDPGMCVASCGSC